MSGVRARSKAGQAGQAGRAGRDAARIRTNPVGVDVIRRRPCGIAFAGVPLVRAFCAVSARFLFVYSRTPFGKIAFL